MAAYIIAEISITDPVEYEEYKKLTPATVAAYDGAFKVRGAKAESLEGNWEPGRVVILQFPSIERAKEWWSSEAYSEAKGIRQRAALSKMIVVEGV